MNNICQTEEALEETSPKQLYENPVEDNLNGKDMILFYCRILRRYIG